MSKITGFVNFPINREDIKISKIGSTLVYLIAFDVQENTLGTSNIRISTNSKLAGDDFTIFQSRINLSNKENILKSLIEKNDDNLIFKNGKSIKLLSSCLIGWSNICFNNKSDTESWVCTFKELTNEGKKLFYSIRKLHNESDIRIITLNTLK